MRKAIVIGGVSVLVGLALWFQFGNQRVESRKIAFIVPTMNNPFFVDMTAAAREAAKSHPEFELLIQAPPEFTNLEQQVAMIENVVTLKVSAICLVAADSKGVVPSLKKAQDAGIPVLLVDNTVDPTAAKSVGLTITVHIGSDNLLGGQLAGQFIGEAIKGQGEVAMLEGVLGSDVANARKQGFLDALKAFPGIRLVASQTANYSREQALDVFQNMIQANPKLDALFAANDEMALGAIKAITQARNQKKIVIVGFDATADGIAAIQQGSMTATVQQEPKEMGRVAVDLATRLAQGQKVPAETKVPVKLIPGGKT